MRPRLWLRAFFAALDMGAGIRGSMRAADGALDPFPERRDSSCDESQPYVYHIENYWLARRSADSSTDASGTEHRPVAVEGGWVVESMAGVERPVRDVRADEPTPRVSGLHRKPTEEAA